MNKLIVIPIFAVFLLVIDVYVLYAARAFFKPDNKKWYKIFVIIFWSITVLSLSMLFFYHFGERSVIGNRVWMYYLTFMFICYFSKGFTMVLILLSDIIKFIIKLIPIKKWRYDPSKIKNSKAITRGEFIKKFSIVSAAIPFTTLSFGVLNGVHNYRVINRKIFLPNLPKSFDGLRIGQISDIHSGSFFDKLSVEGGIEMLLNEKPDIVFFTGDLVNNETKEIDGYIDIFRKVSAPLGVYAVLGNHDYGDYKVWPSEAAKEKNLRDMYYAHELLGWKLLNNSHEMITQGDEQIAIIGVENWGTGRFPKYGDLASALSNTQDAKVKLLLSHDPSHWDAVVKANYPEIDVMFAGHTHGFQFGIETQYFRWSPSQYVYKQWADLYQSGSQYLYVNRGFGFLGFPGRIGIEPEITIIELTRTPLSA